MTSGWGILRGTVGVAVAAAVLVIAEPTGTAGYFEAAEHPTFAAPRTGAAPIRIASAAAGFTPEILDVLVETMAIARGDTLMTMLVELGIDRAQAERAILALGRYVSPTELQIGQELTVILATTSGDGGAQELRGLSLDLTDGRHAVAVRRADGRFRAKLAEEPIGVADVGLAIGAADASGATEDPILERLVIRRGDTLLDRLVALGSSRLDADQVIRALLGHVDLRNLQIGQEVTVVMAPKDGEQTPRLAAVSVALKDTYVTADRDAAGAFDVRRTGTPLSLAVPGITTDALVFAPFVDPFAAEEISEPDPAATPSPTQSGPVPPLPVARPAAEPALVAAADALRRTIRIGRGDTLNDLLTDVGVSAADAKSAIDVLKQSFNPRKLQIGDRLTAILDPSTAEDADGRLRAIRLVAGEQVFDVARGPAGAFALQGTATVEALPPLPARVAGNSERTWSILPRHHERDGPEDDRFTEEGFEIGEGDTLLKVLALAGASDRDAKAAVTALRKHVNPRRLQLGQAISVIMDRASDDGRPRLLAVNVAREGGDFIVAAVRGKGFTAEITGAPFTLASLVEGIVETQTAEVSPASGDVPLPTLPPSQDGTTVAALGAVVVPVAKPTENIKARLQRADGVIVGSLYQAAEDAGLPNEIMNDLISALSYDVDFQRDLHRGDRFEVMYELLTDNAGEFVRYGSPLYAHLSLSGRDLRIYLFTPESGRPDYYHGDGSSVRKTLLRTPISGARVTSDFGKRKDPFQGYTKMHKGVDFGAPKGTPVLAAGSGVIEYVGKYYGYGKYIRIRHSGTFETAYAHMSKFAKGLEVGSTVEQGEIIGYVGCTGRCTGNHLHYEVLANDEQIDPNGVDLPTGHQLEGIELATFLRNRIELEQQFARLSGPEQLASQ